MPLFHFPPDRPQTNQPDLSRGGYGGGGYGRVEAAGEASASCAYFRLEILCLHQAGPCGGVQASQAGIPSALTTTLCCSFQGYGGFIPGDNAHSKH